MLLAALLSRVSLFAHTAIKCKDRGVGHDSELENRACVTQAAWTPESYKELECRQTLKCFQWFSAAMLLPWQECPCYCSHAIAMARMPLRLATRPRPPIQGGGGHRDCGLRPRVWLGFVCPVHDIRRWPLSTWMFLAHG